MVYHTGSMHVKHDVCSSFACHRIFLAIEFVSETTRTIQITSGTQIHYNNAGVYLLFRAAEHYKKLYVSTLRFSARHCIRKATQKSVDQRAVLVPSQLFFQELFTGQAAHSDFRIIDKAVKVMLYISRWWRFLAKNVLKRYGSSTPQRAWRLPRTVTKCHVHSILWGEQQNVMSECLKKWEMFQAWLFFPSR